MTTLEGITFWTTVALYTASTVAILAGVIFKRESWLGIGTWIAAVGALAHAAAIGVRWYEAGHFPYIEDYENILVGAFAMVVVWLLLGWRWRWARVAGVLVMPVVLLTMGYGITQAAPAGPITPIYQSGWLVVHVTFAWVTYATYAAVAGLAVAILLRARAERKGVEPRGIPSWVPAGDKIDDLSLKLVAFGFLNNAVMIASGAMWAYRLWGNYWSWDPVETWSLLTWLAYGLYMHAYLTLGWRGKRLAWIALFALFGIMMTFWGVQLAPTSYHLFRDMGGTMMEMARPQ